jgi:preprotein translocase subunit SecF
MKIEQEIAKIKDRNTRVELDKKWETSLTRKISICVLTYIIIVVFLVLAQQNGNIFLTALVPVIGFFLSTLSLVSIRKIWEKRVRKT